MNEMLKRYLNRAMSLGNRYPWLIIGLATLLVWGQTCSYQFVWDDTYFIEDLQSIRSLRHIPEMFVSLEAQSSYPEGFRLFRPLRTVHYAVLYFLGGGQARPGLFHLANVAWHALAALLLYEFLSLLLARVAGADAPEDRERWLALLAALAFAVHPVVSETVCWAKALDDVMAAVFTLASGCLLLRWQPGVGRSYTWAVVLFALAVYSKISAVPFFAVVFLILWRVLKLPWRASCRYGAGFAAVALVFLVHRHWVIGQSHQTAPISGTYFQTLVDTVPVLTQYVRLLLGIPPFCADYSYLKGGHAIVSGPVLLGLTVFLGLTGIAVCGLVKPGWQAWGLGSCWTVAFLLPVLNIVPSMQYMAERFLYLPLVGWLLGWAAVMARSRRWLVLSSVNVLVVAIWGVLAWNRAGIWKDEVTLFVRTSLENPRSERVEDNAVAAVCRLPHMRMVYRAAQRPGQPLRLVMQHPEVLAQADWPRVTATLEELHKLFPQQAAVSTALGLAAIQRGDLARGTDYFELATRQQPGEAVHWSNVGLAYLDAGRDAEGETALRHATALAPQHVSAWKSLSALYWRQARYAEARAACQKLQELEPDNPEHARWIGESEQKLAQSKPGDSATGGASSVTTQ